MNDLVNNPWFVGIGGGVLSGLLVAIITRILFSRRDKREYVQKLNVANSEVLYAIRPGVSEGVIPDSNIVTSLIHATARKYAVDSSDMYSTSDLADELIKEVMDSSFISAQSKMDFCSKLAGFKAPIELVDSERSETARDYDASEKYRKQTVAILSLMAGLTSASMGLVAAFGSGDQDLDKKVPFLLMPAALTIAVALIIRVLKDLKAQALKLRFGGNEIVFGPRKKEAEPDGGGNA